VFRDLYFWALFWGFFCGVGGSLVILTHAKQIWQSYNTDPNLDSWGDRILVVYSFTNAASNVICGVLSDWLATKNILRRTSFVSLVHLLFAIVFCVIAVLFQLKDVSVVTAFLLASVGIVTLPNRLFLPNSILRLFVWCQFSALSYNNCRNLWWRKLWQSICIFAN
jgi:hypothetical protein